MVTLLLHADVILMLMLMHMLMLLLLLASCMPRSTIVASVTKITHASDTRPRY